MTASSASKDNKCACGETLPLKRGSGHRHKICYRCSEEAARKRSREYHQAKAAAKRQRQNEGSEA